MKIPTFKIEENNVFSFVTEYLMKTINPPNFYQCENCGAVNFNARDLVMALDNLIYSDILDQFYSENDPEPELELDLEVWIEDVNSKLLKDGPSFDELTNPYDIEKLEDEMEQQSKYIELGNFENDEKVYYKTKSGKIVQAPVQEKKHQKFPIVSTNVRGTVVLAWLIKSGWNTPMKVNAQIFDSKGRTHGPVVLAEGSTPGNSSVEVLNMKNNFYLIF